MKFIDSDLNTYVLKKSDSVDIKILEELENEVYSSKLWDNSSVPTILQLSGIFVDENPDPRFFLIYKVYQVFNSITSDDTFNKFDCYLFQSIEKDIFRYSQISYHEKLKYIFVCNIDNHPIKINFLDDDINNIVLKKNESVVFPFLFMYNFEMEVIGKLLFACY